MPKGIDCAVSIAARAPQIKAAGYDFVCRYYFPYSNWREELSVTEAIACKTVGLYIVSVYEANPTTPGYFTRDRADADATIALGHAKHVGQPQGTPIYFAYDYDADPVAITPYAETLHAMMTDKFGGYYEAAAYGSGAVISHLKGLGLIKRGWLAQSEGWSGYDDADGGEELQQGREVTLFGMDVDLDVSDGRAGGWMLP